MKFNVLKWLSIMPKSIFALLICFDEKLFPLLHQMMSIFMQGIHLPSTTQQHPHGHAEPMRP